MHYAKLVKCKHFFAYLYQFCFNVSIKLMIVRKNNKVLFLFLCSFNYSISKNLLSKSLCTFIYSISRKL